MGICPKVNVIARLEYELAYYDSAVHRFNYYTTRTPHANNTKAQINYVFINKKWNNSAYSSFEGVSSDHWIVMAKIRLSLRRNAARTTTTVHYDWSLLNNRDIRDKYTYRTLHSYKLFWAVCHLFPQRWRTLNVQSRETIGQEDHVIYLQLRRRA